MTTIRFLYTYIRKYFRLFILAAFLAILVSALSIGSFGAIVPTLNILFDPYIAEDGTQEFIRIPEEVPGGIREKVEGPVQSLNENFQGRHYDLLIMVMVFFIVINFFKCFCMFLKKYLQAYIGNKIVQSIRNDLYRRILTLDFYFFGRFKSGDLMSRLLDDTGRVQKSVTREVMNLLSAPIDIIVKMVTLFLIAPVLSIFVFCVYPFIAVPIVIFGRKIKKYSRRAMKKTADLNSIIKETISGIEIVQAFNMTDYEHARFEKKNHRLVYLRLKNSIMSAVSRPILEFCVNIGISIIVLWGGYLVLKRGTLQSDIFIFYLGILASMYRPVKDILRANNQLQEGMASADRVFQIMNEQNQVVEREDAKKLDRVEKGLVFDNVSFEYNTEEPVLCNIDLEVPLNKCVAIVGPSGAGKTTLVHLVPRFIEPSSGRVLIDGEDYKNYTIESIRAQIGIVMQDVFLFDDTIRNNIAYGHPEIELERVIEAAKHANAHDFIMNLPGQYDTMIGELGDTLSGGEKQRLSIARAILKNPSILLLDEATSSLDSEAEALVQQALDYLMKDRSTFIIAHRLSTVKNADEIIFLKDGCVCERGTHEELIEKNGYYAQFFRTQFLTP